MILPGGRSIAESANIITERRFNAPSTRLAFGEMLANAAKPNELSWGKMHGVGLWEESDDDDKTQLCTVGGLPRAAS